MTVLFHLRLSGAGLILLGLAHLWFSKPLQWKQDLAKLTLVNRQIFLVHCFYVALILVLLGILSLTLADSLLQPTPLARAMLCGMTLLWALRLYIQWRVFDPSLWRQNRTNHLVHYVLTAVWVYLTAVDGVAAAKTF